MDAYEATRIVFSRIQTLDPENAAQIMGLLLIQDHGEKEMIRLAFGPETLLHSLLSKARKDLGLLPSSTSPSVSPAPSPNFLLSRQNSASRPSPLSVSSPSSWAPPPVFSRSNSCNGATLQDHDLQHLSDRDDLIISPGCNGNSSPFFSAPAATDLIDELQLQEQLSFLHESAAAQGQGQGEFMDYAGIGAGHHRRSCSVSDICFSGDGLGWKPCLYYARGYCKNGTSCRFVHGLPDETAMVEQELLLRSKSQRLMAAASGFPFSPTGSMPASPSASSKCLNFLLQQQSDNQRAVAAAAALMLGGGGDDAHKFMGRSRFDRVDFMNMMNPSSRQIYLTFPADSTFREEDVSNYFSIYGPVQDVRIPYQQKRMFGFVTFVYPETVKLILAKGNPHFICDARVLVKPYKEKGKVPEKYRSKPAGDRGDFSDCSTPTGLDSRDSFDLQQLGARMLHGNNTTEMLIRRKLEEQQQAAELQQAIELQSRRLMGLQLLDLKSRNFSSRGNGNGGGHNATMGVGSPAMSPIARSSSISPDETHSEEKSWTEESSSFGQQRRRAVNVRSGSGSGSGSAADKEESTDEASPNAESDFQESSVEHNLPDSPFASPTAAKSAFKLDPFSVSDDADADADADLSSINSANGNGHLFASPLLSPASSLDMAAAKSFFLPVTRISSDHGAIGM